MRQYAGNVERYSGIDSRLTSERVARYNLLTFTKHH
jgi:hypothetical protein